MPPEILKEADLANGFLILPKYSAEHSSRHQVGGVNLQSQN